MSGSRTKLNNVSEAKILSGSRAWPVAEYVTKETTDARTGIDIATAFTPDLMRSSERMNLDGSYKCTTLRLIAL